jgi:hypothetical protein
VIAAKPHVWLRVTGCVVLFLLLRLVEMDVLLVDFVVVVSV